MSSETVWIDDTDPSIDYDGDWAQVDGKLYDGFVENGKVFWSTLHELKSGEGSFALTFYGSAGKVVGTNVPKPDVEQIIKPKWTCAIDGVPVVPPAESSVSANNWAFCEWSALSGRHNLTVNVSFEGTDPSLVQPFLLDYISYQPSREQHTGPYDKQAVSYPVSHIDMNFDNSWVATSTGGMRSGSGGSKMTFNFWGNGLEVLGYLPGNPTQNITATTATFSLDNGNANAFPVASRRDTDVDFHQFFQLSNLTLTSHNVAITYSGNSTTMPLILDQFIVYNIRSEHYGVQTWDYRAPFPVSAILGIVMGGIVALIVLGFGLTWCRRRRLNAARRLNGQPHTAERGPEVVVAFAEQPTQPLSTLVGPSSKQQNTTTTLSSNHNTTTASSSQLDAIHSSSQGQPASFLSPTYIVNSNPFLGSSLSAHTNEQPPMYTPT